jgi:hypothetical protein
MSETIQGSGGAAQASGGSEEKKQSDNTTTESGTVSYESYQKLLKEKKSRDEELAKLRKEAEDRLAQERAAQEQALKDKENWKELAALREQEKTQAEQKAAQALAETQAIKSQLANNVKRRALLDAVSGVVPEQYSALLPIDEIVMNPETGRPDPASVQAVAMKFQKTYPHIIEKRGGPRLPAEAARGTGAALTYEEWLKLPTKEMKARAAEVIQK